MLPSTDLLRRSAAHVLVDDLADPQLTDRMAHHLLRVRRLREDEMVTMTDGRGRWRTGRLIGSGFTELGGTVEEPGETTAGELLVAIPKQERPEWIVQKATELGIARVVFLHADRSVVRWEGERAAKHLSKLRTVAAEALMQCRRTRLPEIVGPVPAVEVIGRTRRQVAGGAGEADGSVDGQLPIVLAEPGGRRLTPGDRRVAIGPEGGGRRRNWRSRRTRCRSGPMCCGSRPLRWPPAC